MMCRGHSHTRMYYKKKRLLLYSFVFLPFSCSLLFFWHFSSVFLPFSCPTPRRPYRYSSILEPQCFFVCFMPSTLPCVCEWWEKRDRESETMRGLQNNAKCLCVCARADRLYFLSIYDDDEDVENARALAPLLPVYFESTRRFFLVPLSPVPV